MPTDAEGVRESLAAAAAVIDVMRLDTSAPDYGLTAETTDYGPTALTHEFFCNPSCDFDKPFFAEKNGRSCMQTVWKIGRVGGRGWALMRREAVVRSVMIHSRTILRVFMCVPANVRVWVRETCVLCAV